MDYPHFIDSIPEDIFIDHFFIDSLKVFSKLRQVNKYLQILSQQVQITKLLEPILKDNEEYSVFKGTKLRHGICSKVDTSGIIVECNYKKDKKDGLSRYWYDEQLSKECNYKEGKKDGLSRYWYDNEQLSQECNYKEGKLDGLLILWYKNGQLCEESIYKEGKKDGLSRLWYCNGQLWEESIYKKGKKDGLSRQWYENGKLASECTYKKNKVDVNNLK